MPLVWRRPVGRTTSRGSKSCFRLTCPQMGFLGVMGVRRRAELPHRPSPQERGLGAGRELLCVVGRRCAEKCREELSLPGHVCIVTGASGGMGAEVAWGLAEAKSERQQKRKKESYNSEPFFSCPSHGSHFALQAGASRVLMACRNA